MNEQIQQQSKSQKKIVVTAVLVGVLSLLLIVVTLLFRPQQTSTIPPSHQTLLTCPAEVNVTQVSITKSGFVPATVEICHGQHITWVNQDTTQHLLTGGVKGVNTTFQDTDQINPNESVTISFTQGGSIYYTDLSNTKLYQGRIIVR